MTYEQAEQMQAKYANLIGREYKGLIISDLLIFPSPVDYLQLSNALRMAKDYGIRSSDRSSLEYEILVLFSLDNWSYGTPAPFQTLEAFLHRNPDLDF